MEPRGYSFVREERQGLSGVRRTHGILCIDILIGQALVRSCVWRASKSQTSAARPPGGARRRPTTSRAFASPRMSRTEPLLGGPSAAERSWRPVVWSTMNLMATTVGTGVLAIPISFSYMGLVPGLAMLVGPGVLAPLLIGRIQCPMRMAHCGQALQLPLTLTLARNSAALGLLLQTPILHLFVSQTEQGAHFRGKLTVVSFAAHNCAGNAIGSLSADFEAGSRFNVATNLLFSLLPPLVQPPAST